jgi:hypothetical protein
MHNKWEKSIKLYSNRKNDQKCNQIEKLAKIAKSYTKNF